MVARDSPTARRGEIVAADAKEYVMVDSKDPNKKLPGEKKSGKYHYNPGNMSGKTIEISKDESEQENNVDRIHARDEHVQKRSDGVKSR